MIFRPSDALIDRYGRPMIIAALLFVVALFATFYVGATHRQGNAVAFAKVHSLLVATTLETERGDINAVSEAGQGDGLLHLGLYGRDGEWINGDTFEFDLDSAVLEPTVLSERPTIVIAVPVADDVLIAEWDQTLILPQSWRFDRYAFLGIASLLAIFTGRAVWHDRSARQTKQLRRRMSRFLKTGEHQPQTSTTHMSPDLARLYDAFDKMAESSVADVEKAKQSTAEKYVLIREVHHRVKNNLQMMSSILSMHLRDTKNPEMISVLRRIQDRVISLATVHADLYQSSTAGAVPVAPLLNEIVDRVEQVARSLGQSLTISRDISEANLLPDQAVPLSLLTAEALNIALKDVVPTGQVPEVLLLSFRAGNRCVLAVEIRDQNLKEATPASIGQQLLEAFATQLHADFTRTSDADLLRFTFSFEVVA